MAEANLASIAARSNSRMAVDSLDAPDFSDDPAGWLKNAGTDLLTAPIEGTIKFGQSVLDIADTGAEFLGGDLVDDYYTSDEAVPEQFKSRTWVGGLLSGVTQFGLGFVVPGGVLGKVGQGISKTYQLSKATGLLGAAGRAATSNFVMKGLVGGAVTDFYAFKGDQGHLADVAVSLGFDNPVTRAMATDADDSWFVGRMKNVLDGVLAGAAFEGAGKALSVALGSTRKALRPEAASAALEAEQRSLMTLYQDPLKAAAEGRISPELAEKLANTKFDDPAFAKDGLSRGEFTQKLTEFYKDQEFTSAVTSLTDAYGKLWAVSQGKSLDDFYKNIADIQVKGGSVDGDALFQIMSAEGVLTGREKFEPTKAYGKRQLLNLQDAFAIRQKKNPVDPYDFSPKTLRKTADGLVEDTLHALTLPENARARGWYTDRVNVMFDTLEEIHPGISKDPKKRLAFLTYLAVESAETGVQQNLDTAAGKLYKAWDESGGKSLADVAKGTEGESAYAVIDGILARNGGDAEKALQELLTPITNKELKAKYGVTVSGEAMDAELVVANVLGPKVGAFFANLAGDAGRLTMDRWWVRTWNRVRGHPMETADEVAAFLSKSAPGVKTGKSRTQDWLDAVEAHGTAEQKEKASTPEGALALARQLSNVGKKTQKTQRSPLDQAALRYARQADPEILSPRSTQERKAMRQTISMVKQTLKDEHNIEMSTADIQAVLWYYEKDIYQRFGAADADGERIDFADAAKKYVEQRRGQPKPGAGLDGGGASGAGAPGSTSDAGAVAGSSLEAALYQRVPSRRKSDPNQLDLFPEAGQPAPLPRGAVQFAPDGRAVISLFTERFDKSTILHELGHVFFKHLDSIDPKLAANAKSLFGGDASSVTSQENFARSFEAYLGQGKTANQASKPLFDKFKVWLTEVYKGVAGSPLSEKLSPETRNFFDTMLSDGWNTHDINAPKPSSRAPNNPVQLSRDVRTAYLKSVGMYDEKAKYGYAPLDENLSRRIADDYEKMKHDPTNPEVAASYAAFSKESIAQYRAILDSGVQLIPSTKDAYASSQAMQLDVEKNKRLVFFKTGEGSMPADHPLAAKTGIVVKDAEGADYELLVNDVFRAVHDFFGHSAEGFQFGPRGEDNAWLAHARMFSPEARRAMTAETRGQNSWVNFGPAMRDADGKLLTGDAAPAAKDRPFAEQKAGLLPDYASQHADLTSPDELAKRLQDTIADNISKSVGPEDSIVDAARLHTNFDRIDTTDRVALHLRAVEVATQGTIDAEIKGVLSLEEINKAAVALAGNEAQLVKDLKSLSADTKDAAQVLVASRMLRAAGAEKLAQVSQRIEAFREIGRPITRDDQLELQALYESLKTIDTHYGILQKQVARAVTSGNIIVDSEFSEFTLKEITAALRGDKTPEAQAASAAISRAVAEGNTPLAESLKAAAAKFEKRPRKPRAPRPKVDATETGLSTEVPPGVEILSPAEAEATSQLAATISDAVATGQTTRVMKAADKAAKAGLFDVFLEYQKAAILSGVPTMVLNGATAPLNMVMQNLSRAVGAGVSGNWSEVKNSVRLMTGVLGSMNTMARWFALNRADPRGFGAVWQTFKNESPTLTPNTFMEGRKAIKAETFGLESSSTRGKIVDGTGRVVRLPFAINQAAEEMWGQLNYLNYIRMKAVDAAEAAFESSDKSPGDRQAGMLMFIDEYVKAAFDDMGAAAKNPETGAYLHEDAVKYSQSINHTQDLVYGLGKTLTEAKQKHPWLDLVLPFVKTPTNMLRTAVRMTPILGQLQERMQSRLMSRTADEVMRARGEMVLGTAIWGSAIYMAAQGQITGNGPANSAERKALEATGWKPYSFVMVGDDGKKEYIEFRRIDPFSTVFGLAADFADAHAYMDEGTRDQLATAMTVALANNLTNKTYLTGLSDTLAAITRPDRSASKFFQSRAAALVPNFVGRAATSDDDALREARSVLDAVTRRIPGLSDTLPPRRDLLGKPVTPSPGYIPFTNTEAPGVANTLSRIASPMVFSRERDDAVAKELARLHYGFSLPSQSMGGVDLTLLKNASGQDAHDRLSELAGEVKIRGRTLRQELERVISSQRYQRLPMPAYRNDGDAPRVKELQSVFADYRNRARRQLLREYPQLDSLLKQQAAVNSRSPNRTALELMQ